VARLGPASAAWRATACLLIGPSVDVVVGAGATAAAQSEHGERPAHHRERPANLA
jgi:hypothetical protein